MSAYDLPAPIEPQPWQMDALCAQADPEAWFPPPGGSPDEAIMICHRCPVLAACREWVMGVETGRSPRARHGIYGGLLPIERYRLTRAAHVDDLRPAEGRTGGESR